MITSDHYKNSKGEQVDFELQVFTRPNLRDGRGEMFVYIGKQHLSKMFDECAVDNTVEDIHLEYPERWCNILELRAIPERMLVVFPNLKKVTIKTHSVYIIQCVHSPHVRIYDDDKKYIYQEGNGKSKDLSVRFCDLPDEFKGLMVL